ncbi:MAG TPA: hypothetical protein VNH22_05730 [Blastocatellia bacterium]|jgi:hypothetical protein|nr:hypothetical protein [Blastocatellia bacterium]
MANKTYSINVTLPDLSAAHAEQQARVEAGSWPRAVKLACEEISKRPHVFGKHIRSARIQLGLIENGAKPDGKKAGKHAVIKEAAPEEGFLFEL